MSIATIANQPHSTDEGLFAVWAGSSHAAPDAAHLEQLRATQRQQLADLEQWLDSLAAATWTPQNAALEHAGWGAFRGLEADYMATLHKWRASHETHSTDVNRWLWDGCDIATLPEHLQPRAEQRRRHMTHDDIGVIARPY